MDLWGPPTKIRGQNLNLNAGKNPYDVDSSQFDLKVINLLSTHLGEGELLLALSRDATDSIHVYDIYGIL